MSAPTAVLLFARSAAAEARAKSYGGRGERIAQTLLRRTQATLDVGDLPIYRSNEVDQHGANFGQRITAAVRAVFARGHARVIVVGADCPTLSAGSLNRATRALEAGREVVGADDRGGAYLIGLRRDRFDATAFAALPWQSRRLHQALRSYLDEQVQLARRADYNHLSELIQDRNLLRQLLPTLAPLLSPPPSPLAATAVAPPSCPGTTSHLRGPPAGRRA